MTKIDEISKAVREACAARLDREAEAIDACFDQGCGEDPDPLP